MESNEDSIKILEMRIRQQMNDSLQKNMKPENIKLFLHKVNSKTQITERVVDIIKAIIDIVLDTLLTALKFVSFIPCFFKSIYAFVLEDEEDFEFIDDEDEVER